MLLRAPVAGRGQEPRGRGDRLPRPPRDPRGRAPEDDQAPRDHRRHGARLRRGPRGSGAGGGTAAGSRRGGPQSSGSRPASTSRGALRRGGARRVRAALPRRRRHPDPRPERRPPLRLPAWAAAPPSTTPGASGRPTACARREGPVRLRRLGGDGFDDSLDAVGTGSTSTREQPALAPDLRFREPREAGWDSQVMQRNTRGPRRGDLRPVSLRLSARREAIRRSRPGFKTPTTPAPGSSSTPPRDGPARPGVSQGHRGRRPPSGQADGLRAAVAVAGASTRRVVVLPGLDNPNVGKNLMIHPVLLAWAQFVGGGCCAGPSSSIELLRRVPRHGRGYG